MLKLLSLIRIVDENGQLSLTNLSLMGMVGKILLQPSSSYIDALGLGFAILNYIAKRVVAYHQAKVQKPSYDLAAMNETINSLKTELATQTNRLSSLSLAAGVRQTRTPTIGTNPLTR